MDVLRYQGRIEYLYTKLFETMFGAHGEKLGDQEIAAYLAENDLMNAKHILYSFTDEEGNELDDEGKAAQLEKAQATAKTLKAIADDAEREAKFDEIMNAESQDPGLAYYPDGYVFGTGEMMVKIRNLNSSNCSTASQRSGQMLQKYKRFAIGACLNRRVFHCVAQFSDITWPLVMHEKLHDPTVKNGGGGPTSLEHCEEKMLRERCNVLSVVTQRRHPDIESL